MFNVSTNLENVCIHNRVNCYYISSNPYLCAQQFEFKPNISYQDITRNVLPQNGPGFI